MLSARTLRTSLLATLLATLVTPTFVFSQDEPAPPTAPRQGQQGRPNRLADEAAKWLDAVEFVPDVVYATITNAEGDERELKLDAAFPKQGGDKPLPAIIYIHGGGWNTGTRNAGWPFTVAFANGGYVAVTIDYRLSPEATFPAAVHDCKAAVRFLRANAEQLGIDPERIGVWGHSAGGHLSSMVALTGDDKDLEGTVGTTGVSSKVACFVSVSGPSALPGVAGGNLVDEFLGGTRDERVELAVQASPVTHVDAGDPPALLVHGTKDVVVNIRQAELLQEKLTSAGVKSELYVVEGDDHSIRDKAAYEKIAAFFDEHLGGHVAKVFDELDWLHLMQLQPRQPQATPNVERPARPREGQNPDRPRPGSNAQQPSPPKAPIPDPLDKDEVAQMSRPEAQDALAKVAGALRRNDDMDDATRKRLQGEFEMLAKRLRELGKD